MKRYDVLLSCITLSLLTNVWTVSAEVITRDKYTVVYSNPGKETSYTYDATKENKPLNFLVISALGGTNNITIKGKLGDSNGPSSTFDTNTSVAELREGDYRFTLDSEKNNAPPSSIMISDGGVTGKNNIVFEDVTVDNHTVSSGIQTMDQMSVHSKGKNGLAAASITFKGVNTINTLLDDPNLDNYASKKSNGIQLFNNGTTVGNYHIHSEVGSTLNVNVTSASSRGRGIAVNHYNNTMGSTAIKKETPTVTVMEFDGDVNVKIDRHGQEEAENYGIGLFSRGSKRNRDTIPDASKLEAIFRGNLKVDVTPVYDAQGNPKSIGDAINVNGKNSKVDIVGGPDKVIQIKGDIHAYNSGIVNLNLGNKDSYFEGEAHIGKEKFTSKQNLFDETVDADDNVILREQDIKKVEKQIATWKKILEKPTLTAKGRENYKKKIADAEASIAKSKFYFDEHGIIKNDAIDTTNNAINLTMSNGAHWKVTNDSMVKDLDLTKGAIVEFGNDKKYVNVSVKHLMGDTETLKMNGNIISGDTDRLVTRKGSDGVHNIDYKDDGAAKTKGHEHLKLVENLGDLTDNKAKYKLLYGTTDQGAYEFIVSNSETSKIAKIEPDGKNDFYLNPNGRLSSGAQAVEVLHNMIYQSNLATMGTLVQRLGETHLDKKVRNSNDIWVKLIGGKYSSDGDVKVGTYSNNYYGIQGGFDWQRKHGGWIAYHGLNVGMLQARGTLDEFSGSIKLTQAAIGGYSSWVHPKTNMYVDIVGRIANYRGGFDMINRSHTDVSSDTMHTVSYLGSVELGRRFYFKKNDTRKYYIEPEAQLTYQSIGGYPMHMKHGLTSVTDDFKGLVLRIGARIGIDSITPGHINPYIKIMHERELWGDTTHTFNEVAVEKPSKQDSWFTYGFGATYISKDENKQFYFEAQGSTKHKVKQNWQINAGFRHRF
ncbi:autotransporter outer membrane beta-barrel domain-containing protein [Veillonella sp. 3960]|uniref:autotransporter outer membrane beta-barrel domain-containing protein n=2 Tax=unclassified Veillonella TaxID=2630086 RepID=UPI0013E091BF|nr:autotransporter outer membrane beta-barrel domain-containing protein [Veillonella sp. 3960]